MVKLLTIIILFISVFTNAANLSKKTIPPKMQCYLDSNNLSIQIEEEAPINAKVSPFDFEENVLVRMLAFQSTLNGIVEFNRNKLSEAYFYFKNASASGSIEALYFLGSLEMNGWGTKKNQSSASLKLQEAMNNGCRAAAFDLGQYYLFKKHPNLEQAKIIFSRYPNDMDFVFYLGLTLFRQGKDEATETIKQAAYLGSNLAKDYLAISTKKPINLKLRKFGSHVNTANVGRFELLIKGLSSYTKGNHIEAFYQINKAALLSRHSVEYNYLLAHMYFLLGNNDRGLKFLQHASHHGYQPAKFDLGLRAYLGRGVIKNNKAACSMLEGSSNAKFQYHCGLVLNDSTSDLDKRRGLLLIKEAAKKGFKLAENSFRDYFAVVEDEWGSYLITKENNPL